MTSPLHGEGPRFERGFTRTGSTRNSGRAHFLITMTYYDSISSGYDELYGEEQLSKLEKVREVLEEQGLMPQKGDTLLDVGCGSGISTRFWGVEAVGIDPSSKLIEMAKAKKDGCSYSVGKAESLPFADDSFDVVVSLTAIQNFEDVRKGLEEIKRVGKGRFILSFLKKAEQASDIKEVIQRLFTPKKVLETDKDVIFVIKERIS